MALYCWWAVAPGQLMITGLLFLAFMQLEEFLLGLLLYSFCWNLLLNWNFNPRIVWRKQSVYSRCGCWPLASAFYLFSVAANLNALMSFTQYYNKFWDDFFMISGFQRVSQRKKNWHVFTRGIFQTSGLERACHGKVGETRVEFSPQHSGFKCFFRPSICEFTLLKLSK